MPLCLVGEFTYHISEFINLVAIAIAITVVVFADIRTQALQLSNVTEGQ